MLVVPFFALCFISANSLGSIPAQVFGNVVNGQYVSGIIYITQNAAQILQGFITSIDSTTGHFTVQQSATTNAFNVVINDPTGVYGPNYTANPLWSVDPQNPR